MDNTKQRKSKEWVMTKNLIKFMLLTLLLGMCLNVNAAVIYLDMDTAATGSGLGSGPLVTSEGAITFTGEFRTTGDPDFIAAGSSGNVLDIDANGAMLDFGFDVSSFEFIFGGNSGEFDIVARDALNNIVDSFYQASTGDGQFAGPVTLSGVGIRSIFWNDTQGSFAPIDNITITTGEVPAPLPLALMGIGVIALGFTRRKV